MLTLAEQNDFVVRNMRDLGAWLGMDGIDRHGLELIDAAEFKTSIEAAVADVDFFRTKKWDGIARLGLYRVAQYGLVRETGARKIVETGALHGLTSAFILEAMRINGSGVLISLDLPSTYEDGPANQDGFDDTLPPELPPGWVVSEKLRQYWDLRLGSSADLLPGICSDDAPIDIFPHDSEHTYETMRLEFDLAWPAIREGGLLAADNIDCNTSFFDFCRRVDRVPYVAPIDPDHAKPAVSGIRFGVIRK